MRLKKTYSSREVAAMTGLTARQLQIWSARGLLSPAIPSRRTAAGGYTERRYTPVELFELLVLADLRQRGFLLFDTQVLNPTTQALGATNIRRQEYLQRLATALTKFSCMPACRAMFSSQRTGTSKTTFGMLS